MKTNEDNNGSDDLDDQQLSVSPSLLAISASPERLEVQASDLQQKIETCVDAEDSSGCQASLCVNPSSPVLVASLHCNASSSFFFQSNALLTPPMHISEEYYGDQPPSSSLCPTSDIDLPSSSPAVSSVSCYSNSKMTGQSLDKPASPVLSSHCSEPCTPQSPRSSPHEYPLLDWSARSYADNQRKSHDDLRIIATSTIVTSWKAPFPTLPNTENYSDDCDKNPDALHDWQCQEKKANTFPSTKQTILDNVSTSFTSSQSLEENLTCHKLIPVKRGAETPLTCLSSSKKASSPSKLWQRACDISSDTLYYKKANQLSQKQQRSKLQTPFRSPMIAKPIVANMNIAQNPIKLVHALAVPRQSLHCASTLRSNETPSVTACSIVQKTKAMGSSAKAASPFKSPLIKGPPSHNAELKSATSSLKIRVLERKAQVLKSAIKIQHDQDEERLNELVKKWRVAGRDAALQLWQIVKDRSLDATSYSLNGTQDGWGWHKVEHDDKICRTQSWGWDSSDQRLAEADALVCTSPSPTELETELYASLKQKPATERKTLLPPTRRGCYYEQRELVINNTNEDLSFKTSCSGWSGGMQNSLGNMLLRLGVAHETLGWNIEEDDFIENT